MLLNLSHIEKCKNITHRQRKKNVYINDEMISRIGSYKRVILKVKRRKISWFGHVSTHETLPNTIIQGRVEGTRKIGRPKRTWMDDVYEWTGMYTGSLLDVMKYRYSWKKLCMTPYHVHPTTTRHGNI